MNAIADGARRLPLHHVTIRVPWHDTGWTGTVCNAPSKNSWCMVLNRIREERKDAAEDKVAGRAWTELSEAELPACLTERGAALNAKAYSLRSRHPFANSSAETHGHFAVNNFRLPPYSVQAIPFRWTRKEDAQAISEELALPFEIEREPQLAFDTVWVNDFVNQQTMLDTFFSALRPERSLVFLYAKRTPLADDPRRVLVGVGRITAIGPAQEHAYNGDTQGKLRGLMWETRDIPLDSARTVSMVSYCPTNTYLRWLSVMETLIRLNLLPLHRLKPSMRSAMSQSTSSTT